MPYWEFVKAIIGAMLSGLYINITIINDSSHLLRTLESSFMIVIRLQYRPLIIYPAGFEGQRALNKDPTVWLDGILPLIGLIMRSTNSVLVDPLGGVAGR
jgi:hypothetical protein